MLDRQETRDAVHEWSVAADAGGSGRAGAHVEGFARMHGMEDALVAGMVGSVARAVTGAVAQGEPDAGASVLVAAATDGDSLAVRVTAPGRAGHAPVGLELAMSLGWDADHVEVVRRTGDGEVVVTIEVPMRVASKSTGLGLAR